MEIAIDVRSLMEGRHSGVEEYTVQIIRAMLRTADQSKEQQRDFSFRLFYNAARRVELPDFGDEVDVQAHRFPNKVLNLLQLAVGRPRWDTLVAADCFFLPNFRLLPLSPEVPLVTTVHDLSFERFAKLFSWRRRLWHRMMRPRLLLKNSTHIIAVSEATKADVVDLYDMPEEKVTVIHSGVSGVNTVPDKEQQRVVRARYQLPPHFALYLGTLEPRKNVVSIIQAFDAIAHRVPHDLVVAGARGWLMKEVDQAVLAAKHRSRIHLPGFIAEEHKAALYTAADIFVYPSLYEGFGFPPLEALLAGTPVITSYNSSLPEVVGEWATLIDPYDVSELALVMEELLGDLPVIDEATRRSIHRRYSWDETARQTLAVIERAATRI